MKSLFIGIDFDDTVVKHSYPGLGEPVEQALETIWELMDAGHKIILYTMRSGERLAEAVEFLESNAVVLYAVNDNPTQKYWTQSNKIFCHLYIDNASLGCPLITEEKGKDFVDWIEVREMLVHKEILE